jgi:hypothetical protein
LSEVLGSTVAEAKENMQTTESIDRLFLELSQFTQATTAKELELVQERDALRLMVTWAYGKLHSRTFNSMDDALELDRLKLYVEHGIRA